MKKKLSSCVDNVTNRIFDRNYAFPAFLLLQVNRVHKGLKIGLIWMNLEHYCCINFSSDFILNKLPTTKILIRISFYLVVNGYEQT